MLLSEAKKKWEFYGLNNIRERRELDIEDLIISYGNEKYGLKGAYKNCMEGRLSTTSLPLDVIWIQEDNRFMLIDGHHRVVEGLLRGERKFMCNVDWKGFTFMWRVPPLNERFSYKKHYLK